MTRRIRQYQHPKPSIDHTNCRSKRRLTVFLSRSCNYPDAPQYKYYPTTCEEVYYFRLLTQFLSGLPLFFRVLAQEVGPATLEVSYDHQNLDRVGEDRWRMESIVCLAALIIGQMLAYL